MTNNANRFSWSFGDDQAITNPGRLGNRQRHLSPHPKEETLEQQNHPSHTKRSSNNIRTTTPHSPPRTFDQILGIATEPKALEKPSLSRVRHTESPLRDRYQADSPGVPPETSSQALPSTDRNEVLRSGGVRKPVQVGVSATTQPLSSSQLAEKPRARHIQQLHPRRTVLPGPLRIVRPDVQRLGQPDRQGKGYSQLQGTDQAHLQKTKQPRPERIEKPCPERTEKPCLERTEKLRPQRAEKPCPERTEQPRLQRAEKPHLQHTERPHTRSHPRPLHTERSLPLLTSQPPPQPPQQPSIKSLHPRTLSYLRTATIDPYTHREYRDWINNVNTQSAIEDAELMSSAIRQANRISRAFDLPPSETTFEPHRLLRRSSSMNAMADDHRFSLLQNISEMAKIAKKWLQEPVGTPPTQK
ncbi:hypothetical protein K505DRAFT_366885 [Melanomma pulvis-pyrius CBS 109.77]|uniref:Uncharacterized protein n=1 Tax=Melanomma pulvis-pyrius CBS 109.77 TaxID=1314802 RepID=A0A6A6WV60_9PLEO|nr:hypothetical protein K505DRAFT_366885 [Melanomma pulvis-pyrius CBS 109.77]